MKDTAENFITTELAKQNVTEAVIAKLKTDYLPLKINGIDDKEGYKKVHDARIVCRDHRTLAEKICKAGREDAIKEQKAWIAKEKEVVAQISEVEQHLKRQEEAIDKIIEDQKIRAERLLKLPGRKEQMKGLEDPLSHLADFIRVFTQKEIGGPITDEIIMRFDDNQWNQAIVIAQKSVLDAQQKLIDDANAKKLLERTIARENELIATRAVLYSDGLGKVYRKGKTSVSEQAIKECVDEGWPKIVELFQNTDVTIKPTPVYTAPKSTQPIPTISEISDEEKLWNYATARAMKSLVKQKKNSWKY